MSSSMSYLPPAVFLGQDSQPSCLPRALIAPSRYIQGDGVLDHLGRYLSIVPSHRVGIVFSLGGQRRFGERLSKSLINAQVDSIWVTFQGECSYEEVDRVEEVLQAEPTPVDTIIAIGGGKCIDTGRFVAHRLGIPVVVFPTLASNDAPCAALSVMYRPDGEFTGIEFFPNSPALVVVDARIVAEAPVRYLVSGMGDAMATWFEAQTCLQNPNGRTVLGTRPTLAANAIGELCANTLFAYGLSAVEAVKRSVVDDALERVVEANTLLSGIGFESGGIAGAHSVAQGLTVIPRVHHHHLHGEMVAIGVLTQLSLEEKEEELRTVSEFFAKVGLPVHLGQIALNPSNVEELYDVIEVAMTLPILKNEPKEVTKDGLLKAMRQVHEVGIEVEKSEGNAPYMALHKH